jgi:hypothetical protein
MRNVRLLFVATCAIALNVAGSGAARAQHIDVLTQQRNSQLVTGTGDFDNDRWTLGLRVFHRDFGSTFAINNPGFNSIGDGSPDMPVGAQALPPNVNLSWDFLPMTINVQTQNLFYWNGQETDGMPGLTPNDVAFGPLPGPGYTLSLFDNLNTKISVNGTNAVVPGGVIVSTNSDGSFHQHRFFQLEDGDGNSLTKPADGLYLLAMRLRMTGLASSLPVFMIFGTPGSSVPAEDDAAFPWVVQQLNLPGDYNHDGTVDAADYVVWRHTLNQTGVGLAADGNDNELVDQADYDFWKTHFGEAAKLIVGSGTGLGAGVEAVQVSEPSRDWLDCLAIAAVFGCRGRRRTVGRTAFSECLRG